MKLTTKKLKQIIKEEISKLNESLLGLPHPLPDTIDADIMLVEKAIEISKLMGTPMPEPVDGYDKYWRHTDTGTTRPPRHQVRRQKSTAPWTRTIDDQNFTDMEKFFPPGSPQLGRTIQNRIAELGRKMDPSSRDYTPMGAKRAAHRQGLLEFGLGALRNPEFYGEDDWEQYLVDWTEEFQRLR